ncbi:hypothetical protein AWN76_015250 [Rhodothermaceae bacterium RA]|nr:hypothetical protein AWN76_015250 [Rhodothermaceae bacterium RA]
MSTSSPSSSTPRSISRRTFLGQAAAGAFAATVLPRHVLGGPGFQAPSDTLNIAVVGAGGRGASVMSALTSENIVALCDVDFGYVQQTVEGRMTDQQGNPRPEYVALKDAYEGATRYADFRQMLDREGRNIDAVVVATPDHVHAVAAAMAMRMGKHVYCEKPLTYSVHEARRLREIAAEMNVVTQMGNQGHSGDDGRRLLEWVWSGAIGPVHEAHIWTNRPIWPQGIAYPDRPETPPSGFDWDLYLGPATSIPYHEGIHPFAWRGWVHFGTGALGDMGAHLIDHTYWALDLGYPTSVEAAGSPFGGPRGRVDSYPLATIVHYEFARGGRDPVRLTWYDGGLLPARPAVMPADAPIDRGGGGMLIGEKGVLVYDTYGYNPRLYPQELEEAYRDAPQMLPRVPEGHQMVWANACKGIGEPTCPFEYAGPLTETMLLGVVALRTGYGEKLMWDGLAGRITNNEEANQYLHREYREGYAL